MPVASRLRRISVLAWLGPLLLGGLARGADPPALTTLRAVAESVLEPGPPGPVDVEAVVTGHNPDGAILLRDDSGSTFAAPAADQDAAAPGDRVRIRGTVYPGVFTNGITVTVLEVLGHGAAPEPRPVGPADLAAGRFYHDLVTAEGVVRSCQSSTYLGWVLGLQVDEGMIEVRCKRLVPQDLADRLVDARVRVTGIGAGEINPARQLLRPFIRVVDPAAIEVLVPAAADPFAAPAVPFERVGSDAARGHRVTVTGVATAPGGLGNGVFLAAGERGLFVSPAVIDDQVRSIRPGDRVEAAGFAAAGPVTPFLADAVVRVRGTGSVPADRPLPDVDTGGMATKDYLEVYRTMWQDALPIEVEFDVMSRHDRDGVAEIAGTTPVKGTRIRGFVSAAVPQAVPGARVRLRGVCRITETHRATFNSFPAAFDVWPASAADVTIVRPAPWVQRPGVVRGLAATLAGCLAAVAATMAWVVVLRRQVRARTRQLAAEMRSRRDAALDFEATLRERNRLAANLHDTLLQTLGGIGYQLDACEGGRGGDEAEARVHFDVARRMVSHASNELHNAVWAMRSLPIRDQTFPDALRTLCDRVCEGHAARIDVHAEGRLDDVPEFVAGNLLLVIQEAVLNALRHGRADAIDVHVTDRRDLATIDVEVRDGGRGFDPATRHGVEQGHFGIQGMVERAERLGGSLVIESLPGRGTTVRARVQRREFDADLAAEPAP